MVIRTHYIWTLLPRCGSCMFWNGFVNGGAPAFAELQGAVLHPLVVFATLVWGGINGTKVILLASLIMAGGAQWWLARVMGLGRLARLWSAAMVVVGGHLIGRMEHGVVGLVLSTAACSLVIAPALDWIKTRRRRSAILLGVSLAGALLSGQFYVQLALFLGVLPALGVYALDAGLPRGRILKGLLFALVLALLLSAVFWVPFLHFSPNFAKDADPDFSSVQPLEYLPLNLVIRDLDFYIGGRTLGRHPYPYLYVNYIGWVPVLLAGVALRFAPRRQRRQLYTLLLAIALVYLCASAFTLRSLRLILPDYVARVRYITVSSGLAVPLVLALAAWGLDMVWRRLKGRGTLLLRLSRSHRSYSALSLVILPVLVYAVYVAHDFSATWLYIVEVPENVRIWIDRLRTDSAQWVSPPFGEHFWTPPALEAGLKVTQMVSPWGWEGRSYPEAYRELIRDTGITMQEHSEQQYASVSTSTGTMACHAEAVGGHIDVVCTTHAPGVLTVKENNWTGWYAWHNGSRIPIDRESDWLTVDAPAGKNHFAFRYRPWDVPLGVVLSSVGVFLCVLLWLSPVNALSGLLPRSLGVDEGIVRVKRWAGRLRARLPSVNFSDRRVLRYCAWLLNVLAIAALLTIFGLRWWFDYPSDMPIMRYLAVVFFGTAFLGAAILLLAGKLENKHPSECVADEDEQLTKSE